MDAAVVIAESRRWIGEFVVGLNLCPFAQRVLDHGKIRFVVTDAVDRAGLLAVLQSELLFLSATDIESVETTLLIHPNALANFLDYNEFLDAADRLIDQLRFRGTFQIASFHPDYQFAGTRPDDVENFTNRSPFPMLHLLREESITRLGASPAELEEIPRRNIRTLQMLGGQRIGAMLQAISSQR